ncbi:MAG TPA: polyphosphate kinase 2 family protein [Candidatus Lumbricidophila sp.]|nr:polyphosphate kinase 2 family protein [Candidatus Lumbricidophila sp.]
MTAASLVSDPRAVLRAGPGARLADIDPDATPGFEGERDVADDLLAAGAERLGGLQEQLFARSRTTDDPRRVLIVLQGMDTSGKGGVIRHVVGAVDPQGVTLASFKKPTAEELAHDFLWRIEQRVPQPGMIGVFDRSHYEDVLIGRVRALAPPAEIKRRYDAINEFESRLVAGGTSIIKVMLHISAEEQKQRLAERLERPDKYWKYNPGDLDERSKWADYQQAYGAVFDRTSTSDAPWFIVPANRKWYARLAVQQLLVDALAGFNLDWPPADFDVAAERARLATL